MTEEELRKNIEEGKEYRFYLTAAWRDVRDQVFRMDHYECQICKKNGRYKRAKIVHHVKHLKDRPDLAVKIYDPETGERQLISVCGSCHEKEHPERLLKYRFMPRKKYVTKERWD